MPLRTLPFPLALLLSLLVHATLFSLLIWGIGPTEFLGGGASVLMASRPPAPAPDQTIEAIQLGLEDSDVEARTWLGYKDDPQEQFASPSEIDQAAFEKDPAGGAAGTDPQADAPQSIPESAAPATPAKPAMDAEAQPPRPEPLQPSREPAPIEPPSTVQEPLAPRPAVAAPSSQTPSEDTSAMMPPAEPMTLPRELDRSERSSDDAEAERIADLAELVESLLPSRRLLERWSPAAREESPEPPVEAHAESEDQSQKPITQPAKEVEQKAAESEGSTAPSQPATPAAPGPPRQRKADGDTADRESDATSTVNVPPDQWRRGRPLAARGLDIKTRRPVFPELTSLTARPGNPVVEIFFDRTGVPRRASIVRSSGDPRVDGPLVDALYRWRASGDVLKLLEGEELYRIELRILLGD